MSSPLIIEEKKRITNAVKEFGKSNKTEQDYLSLLVDGYIALMRVHPNWVKEAISEALKKG